MNNDLYSDEENDFIYSEIEEFTIDDFYFNFSDDVYDILFDLRERFFLSPFFISHLCFSNLTQYLSNFVVYNQKTPPLKKKELVIYFKHYYKNEIDISYNIIINFMKKFKRNIPYDNWVLFCFNNSNLYELRNYPLT